MLKSAVAAIGCLFEALRKSSPTHNTDIKRLVSGLVKTQTFLQMRKSKPMSVEPFTRLFKHWGDNSKLSLKQLR